MCVFVEHLGTHEAKAPVIEVENAAIKSVTRSMGPTKQSAMFDFGWAFCLTSMQELLREAGRCSLREVLVIGELCILCDVEISLVHAGSVCVNREALLVTATLLVL